MLGANRSSARGCLQGAIGPADAVWADPAPCWCVHFLQGQDTVPPVSVDRGDPKHVFYGSVWWFECVGFLFFLNLLLF